MNWYNVSSTLWHIIFSRNMEYGALSHVNKIVYVCMHVYVCVCIVNVCVWIMHTCVHRYIYFHVCKQRPEEGHWVFCSITVLLILVKWGLILKLVLGWQPADPSGPLPLLPTVLAVQEKQPHLTPLSAGIWTQVLRLVQALSLAEPSLLLLQTKSYTWLQNMKIL